MSSKYLNQNVPQDNINLRVNDLRTNGTLNVDQVSLLFSNSKIDLGVSGDIETSTVIGSNIATTPSQKISFHGQAPSTQHTSTGETVGVNIGSGTTIRDDSTFTGNTGTKAYTVSDIVKALKNKGLLAES